MLQPHMLSITFTSLRGATVITKSSRYATSATLIFGNNIIIFAATHAQLHEIPGYKYAPVLPIILHETHDQLCYFLLFQGTIIIRLIVCQAPLK